MAAAGLGWTKRDLAGQKFCGASQMKLSGTWLQTEILQERRADKTDPSRTCQIAQSVSPSAESFGHLSQKESRWVAANADKRHMVVAIAERPTASD